MNEITEREAKDLAHETLLSKGQAYVVLGLKRGLSKKEINREMDMRVHKSVDALMDEVHRIRRELPDELDKERRTVDVLEDV
jgi:hypothetical protein